MIKSSVSSGAIFEEALTFELKKFVTIPAKVGQWEYDRNDTAVAVLKGSRDFKKIVKGPSEWKGLFFAHYITLPLPP